MSNDKGFTELVFGLFDRLTVAKDGRSRLFNLLSLMMIFFIAFTVYQWDEIKHLYQETRFEFYIEAVEFERNKNYLTTVQQQLQILYINSKADLTVVYEYYPPNQHFFYNVIFFEGALPEGKRIEDVQAVPIDKTSEEYMTHLNGLPFMSDTKFKFFPDELRDAFQYVYSCPIFNLNNVYAGNISMVWYNKPDLDEQDYKDLHTMCFQSSRVLGRSK